MQGQGSLTQPSFNRAEPKADVHDSCHAHQGTEGRVLTAV